MRRRLLWILGGFAIGAVMLGGIMLLAGTGRSEFEFLRGQKALQFKEADIRAMRPNGRDSGVYTFKANGKALTRRARAELIERGYQDVTAHAYVPDSAFVYAKGDVQGYISALKTSKPFRGDYESVSIVEGMRYIPYPLKMDYDEEWVTVYVTRDVKPSVFEQFKAWIGL
jgi:hypothetical protein